MRKCMFEKGKRTAAAAALAFVLAAGSIAGCGGSGGLEEAVQAVGEAVGGQGEDSQETAQGEAAQGEDAQAEGEAAETAPQLPEYAPVNPESVPESAEGDFIYEDYGDSRIYITGYQGPGGQVKIPAHLGGAETMAIMKDAFKTNETITYIYIPETVTRIEEYSFRDCTGLEEAYIAADALAIEKSTFRGCTALRRVVLAGSVSTIEGEMDSGAFQGCTSLTEVVCPDTLNNHIQTNAFYGCTALETVDLSNTQLQGIGQLAFGYCTNLKTVKLPGTAQWVQCNSFMATPNLQEFDVGEGNTALEVQDGVVYTIDFCGSESPNTALFGLEGAMSEDLVIREGTERVTDHAFQHNQKVRTVTLPDSVTSIGSNAFSDCQKLAQVNFGNGVELIEQRAFEGCSSLEEVVLPASLTEMEDSCFSYCGLKKVSLPDGVKYSSGSTTQEYVFAGDKDAVFTFQGKEYTYDQAAELDALLAQ